MYVFNVLIVLILNEINSMNKSELVLEIQSKLGEGATKACAERALEAVLDSFKTAIKKDGAVQLVGFGSFSVTERKARQGVNPQTGKPIQIAASKTIKFKPSASFKGIC